MDPRGLGSRSHEGRKEECNTSNTDPENFSAACSRTLQCYAAPVLQGCEMQPGRILSCTMECTAKWSCPVLWNVLLSGPVLPSPMKTVRSSPVLYCESTVGWSLRQYCGMVLAAVLLNGPHGRTVELPCTGQEGNEGPQTCLQQQSEAGGGGGHPRCKLALYRLFLTLSHPR